jgi:hypothetical protein
MRSKYSLSPIRKPSPGSFLRRGSGGAVKEITVRDYRPTRVYAGSIGRRQAFSCCRARVWLKDCSNHTLVCPTVTGKVFKVCCSDSNGYTGGMKRRSEPSSEAALQSSSLPSRRTFSRWTVDTTEDAKLVVVQLDRHRVVCLIRRSLRRRFLSQQNISTSSVKKRRVQLRLRIHLSTGL